MSIEQIEHLEKLLNSYKCILMAEKSLNDPVWAEVYNTVLTKRKEEETHLLYTYLKELVGTREADLIDKLGEYNGFICAHLRGIREAIEKLSRGDSLKISLPPVLV